MCARIRCFPLAPHLDLRPILVPIPAALPAPLPRPILAPLMGKSPPRIFGKCAPNEKHRSVEGSGPCSVSTSPPTSILERNRMGILQIHRGAEFLKMSEAKMQDCSSKNNGIQEDERISIGLSPETVFCMFWNRSL